MPFLLRRLALFLVPVVWRKYRTRQRTAAAAGRR
jgi:cbb3-type cytochrome oxidase subunit 3